MANRMFESKFGNCSIQSLILTALYHTTKRMDQNIVNVYQVQELDDHIIYKGYCNGLYIVQQSQMYYHILRPYIMPLYLSEDLILLPQ